MDDPYQISLYRELPRISRARGFRLYTVTGSRFLDLYQDAGGAVLGHRPGNLEKILKNTMSRGLYAALPSVYSGRFFSALSVLFSDMSCFALYSTRLRAVSALGGLGFTELVDPVNGSVLWNASGSPAVHKPCAVWRPFSDIDYSTFPAILPLLPFPGSHETSILCFRENAAVSEPDPVSAAVLSGFVRVLHDLLWALEHGRCPEACNPAEGLPGSIRLWTRKGIYLVPLYGRDSHPVVFRYFLSRNVLLPPSFSEPCILPGEWSAGEKNVFLQTDAGIPLEGF